MQIPAQLGRMRSVEAAWWWRVCSASIGFDVVPKGGFVRAVPGNSLALGQFPSVSPNFGYLGEWHGV